MQETAINFFDYSLIIWYNIIKGGDNMKKKNIRIICAILTSIVILVGVYFQFKETGKLDTENLTKAVTTVTNAIADEKNNVVVDEYAVAESEDTKTATLNGESVATTEEIEDIDENKIIDEGATETDAVIEQENISYDGDNTGNGLSLLGAYQGLTYYSQADSRWANVMYSSVGDSSQTMKSSACRSDIRFYCS
jgi:hypothetical protein